MEAAGRCRRCRLDPGRPRGPDTSITPNEALIIASRLSLRRLSTGENSLDASQASDVPFPLPPVPPLPLEESTADLMSISRRQARHAWAAGRVAASSVNWLGQKNSEGEEGLTMVPGSSGWSPPLRRALTIDSRSQEVTLARAVSSARRVIVPIGSNGPWALPVPDPTISAEVADDATGPRRCLRARCMAAVLMASRCPSGPN